MGRNWWPKISLRFLCKQIFAYSSFFKPCVVNKSLFFQQGFNEKMFGENWGGEDWEVMDRIVGKGIYIIHQRLPRFYHIYHDRKEMWVSKKSKNKRQDKKSNLRVRFELRNNKKVRIISTLWYPRERSILLALKILFNGLNY